MLAVVTVKQAVAEFLTEFGRVGGASLQVIVLQGMKNSWSAANQLLEDMKTQLEPYLKAKNVPVTFNTVEKYAREKKIEGDDIQQVKAIVEYLAKNSSSEKRIVLFMDEVH